MKSGDQQRRPQNSDRRPPSSMGGGMGQARPASQPFNNPFAALAGAGLGNKK
jgi:hypothetical protein